MADSKDSSLSSVARRLTIKASRQNQSSVYCGADRLGSARSAHPQGGPPRHGRGFGPEAELPGESIVGPQAEAPPLRSRRMNTTVIFSDLNGAFFVAAAATLAYSTRHTRLPWDSTSRERQSGDAAATDSKNGPIRWLSATTEVLAV